MDPNEIKYLMAIAALMIVVSFHNLIKSVSILFSQVDNKKSLGLVKILYNLFGFTFGIISIAVICLRYSKPIGGCQVTSDAYKIIYMGFSESISLFLVWKLRQIKEFDKTLYAIFVLRMMTHIAFMLYSNTEVLLENSLIVCNIGLTGVPIKIVLMLIATELLGGSYFVFHYSQYVRRNLMLAKNNEVHIPLPTSLIGWDVFRFSIIMIYHMLPIPFLFFPKFPIILYTAQTTVFVFLSYTITFDMGKSETTLKILPKILDPEVIIDNPPEESVRVADDFVDIPMEMPQSFFLQVLNRIRIRDAKPGLKPFELQTFLLSQINTTFNLKSNCSTCCAVTV